MAFFWENWCKHPYYFILTPHKSIYLYMHTQYILLVIQSPSSMTTLWEFKETIIKITGENPPKTLLIRIVGQLWLQILTSMWGKEWNKHEKITMNVTVLRYLMSTLYWYLRNTKILLYDFCGYCLKFQHKRENISLKSFRWVPSSLLWWRDFSCLGVWTLTETFP